MSSGSAMTFILRVLPFDSNALEACALTIQSAHEDRYLQPRHAAGLPRAREDALEGAGHGEAHVQPAHALGHRASHRDAAHQVSRRASGADARPAESRATR